MGLSFENNTIENFDVVGTFGTMNFLEVVAINERDGEGNVTDDVREQRVTVYSSKLNDQVEIAIDPGYDVSDINYDDEIELTGNVTARGWLNAYNYFIAHDDFPMGYEELMISRSKQAVTQGLEELRGEFMERYHKYYRKMERSCIL